MIIIRDDDVLINSSEWNKPPKKFRRVHRWICEDPHFLHVPAILAHNVVDDGTPGLLAFPETIEYIKEETKKGRMRPEIHGWEHIDYGKKTLDEVREDLKKMKFFLHEVLDAPATTWYTPWGASQPHLHEAAALEGLKCVDTNDIVKLKGEESITRKVMDGGSFDPFDGREILVHWWESGSRLLRVIKAHKYGSWKAAIEADPELYT